MVVLDPSTVGTSTSIHATWYPYQRKSFYANERFWVFYSYGNDMVFSSSTDGSTWSSRTIVRALAETAGRAFSVWFNNTYVFYAARNNRDVYNPKTDKTTTYYEIYFRRGTPNSDGTITWSSEATAVSSISYISFPSLSVDSGGFPWIGYYLYAVTNQPYVTKSSTNDGTWTTASGFPYRLSLTSAEWCVIPVPLTATKMFVIYGTGNSTVKAQSWNGSVWSGEIVTASALEYVYASAVAEEDDVHLTFLKVTDYDILYVKYNYNTNSFGSETTLQAGATSDSAPVISRDDSNNLYVFWAGYPTANHIYYRKYNGTWQDRVDWIDESADVLTDNDLLTCFYQSYSNKIGLTYMTKTASPYNVRFAFLSTIPPVEFASKRLLVGVGV